jgi:hypothetical protein
LAAATTTPAVAWTMIITSRRNGSLHGNGGKAPTPHGQPGGLVCVAFCLGVSASP